MYNAGRPTIRKCGQFCQGREYKLHFCMQNMVILDPSPPHCSHATIQLAASDHCSYNDERENLRLVFSWVATGASHPGISTFSLIIQQVV